MAGRSPELPVSAAITSPPGIGLPTANYGQYRNGMATSIYVALLAEGTTCWRPVKAVQVGEGVYQILEQPMPDDELWEFHPGEVVRCELHGFSEGQGLRAYARTTG